MDWFTGESTMEKKSALRNAVAVMLADGKIEPNEIKTLRVICARLGLDTEVLKEVLDNPEAIEFVVPQDDHEKACQMVDIVFMMMSDADIDEKELDFCRAVAMRFGYHSSIVGKLVLGIVEAIKSGKDRGHAVGTAKQALP